MKQLELALQILTGVMIVALLGWALTAQSLADKRKKTIADKKELIKQLSAANSQFMVSLAKQGQSVSYYVDSGKRAMAEAESAKKRAKSIVDLQDQLIQDLIDQLPSDDPEVIRVRMINEAQR